MPRPPRQQTDHIPTLKPETMGTDHGEEYPHPIPVRRELRQIPGLALHRPGQDHHPRDRKMREQAGRKGLQATIRQQENMAWRRHGHNSCATHPAHRTGSKRPIHPGVETSDHSHHHLLGRRHNGGTSNRGQATSPKPQIHHLRDEGIRNRSEGTAFTINNMP